MKWTSSRPKQAGWYWFKKTKDGYQTVVLVDSNLGSGFDVYFMYPNVHRLPMTRGWHCVEDVTGFWAGPIDKPE